MFATWVSGHHTIFATTDLCEENDINCSSDSSRVVHESSQAEFTQENTMKVIYSHKKYKYYFNNDLIFTSKETTVTPKFIWIGNPLDPATPLLWPNFEVDYIHLQNRLGVDLLTQVDPLWKTDEFDSALTILNGDTQTWTDTYNNSLNPQGHSNGTIGWWGCSTTSTAMILNYYDITLPDGAKINPTNLNDWLKDNHGYQITKSNGHADGAILNWGAINRLSQTTYDAQNTNANYHGKILQLQTVASTSENIALQINNNHPLIVHNAGLWSAFGHFFVADGYYLNDADANVVDGSGNRQYYYSTLYIQDPMDRHTEIDKNNNVDQVILYQSKSNPNILATQTVAQISVTNPYLAINTTDSNNQTTGIDAQGNRISQIPNSQSLPLYRDQTPNNLVDAKQFKFIKTAHAAEPNQWGNQILLTDFDPQNFKITLENQIDTAQSGDLLITINNSDGTTTDLPDQEFSILGHTTQEFQLNFSDDQDNQLVKIETEVTLDGIEAFINTAYDNGNIYHFYVKRILIKRLHTVQHLLDKGGKFSKIWVNIYIKHIIRLTQHLTPRFIESNTSQEIVQMLQTYSNHLD